MLPEQAVKQKRCPGSQGGMGALQGPPQNLEPPQGLELLQPLRLRPHQAWGGEKTGLKRKKPAKIT